MVEVGTVSVLDGRWRGEVVLVPRGRLPVPGDVHQDLVTDTGRIRAELGYREDEQDEKG